MPQETIVIQCVLASKQPIVHVPEAALRSGGPGNFRRVLRVRVDGAHRAVTKGERELIPERLLQSVDDFDGGTAIRTFE